MWLGQEVLQDPVTKPGHHQGGRHTNPKAETGAQMRPRMQTRALWSVLSLKWTVLRWKSGRKNLLTTKALVCWYFIYFFVNTSKDEAWISYLDNPLPFNFTTTGRPMICFRKSLGVCFRRLILTIVIRNLIGNEGNAKKLVSKKTQEAQQGIYRESSVDKPQVQKSTLLCHHAH